MNPINPSELSEHTIKELARDNPIVYAAYTAYLARRLTYEQCLTAMVIWLAEYSGNLAELSSQRLAQEFPKAVIKTLDLLAEELSEEK